MAEKDEDEAEPTAEERAQAAALARALDEESSASGGDASGQRGGGAGGRADESGAAVAEALEAARLLRAASGRAAPLGEVAARSAARRALDEVAHRRTVRARQSRAARRWGLGFVAAAVVVALIVWAQPRLRTPLALCSRTAGLLVPGPFAAGQSPSARLDLVAADRLLAWRELRVRRARGER